MSKPDIQYFDHDATWVRPEHAAAVEVIARLEGENFPSVHAFHDDGKIPPEIAIEVTSGYVLVVTHLAVGGSEEGSAGSSTA